MIAIPKKAVNHTNLIRFPYRKEGTVVPHKTRGENDKMFKAKIPPGKIPDHIALRVGGNLRRMRESRGMNQTELSRRLRTGPARISNIEYGRSGFSIQFLIRISKVLDYDIGEFFCHKGSETSNNNNLNK